MFSTRVTLRRPSGSLNTVMETSKEVIWLGCVRLRDVHLDMPLSIGSMETKNLHHHSQVPPLKPCNLFTTDPIQGLLTSSIRCMRSMQSYSVARRVHNTCTSSSKPWSTPSTGYFNSTRNYPGQFCRWCLMKIKSIEIVSSHSRMLPPSCF